LLFAYQPRFEGGDPKGAYLMSGTLEVNDAGTVSILGNPRTLECPESFSADDADSCDFERVTPVTTSRAVPAADLVVHETEPWLVTIVADVVDACDTFTLACTEALPCECVYRFSGSAVRAELRLTPLDDPARALSLSLPDFPRATVSLQASSSDAGAILIAIAERQFTADGSEAGTAIDYAMITP
jgi:hypothetical protein